MVNELPDIGKFIEMFIKMLPGVIILTVGGVVTSALPGKIKMVGLIPIGYGAYLIASAFIPEEVGPGDGEIIEANVNRSIYNPQELNTFVRIRNVLETKGRFRIHAVHRNVDTGYGFPAGDDVIIVVDGGVETGWSLLKYIIPVDADPGLYDTEITLIDDPTVGEAGTILDTLRLEGTFSVGEGAEVPKIEVL